MQDSGTKIKCNICGDTAFLYQDTHGIGPAAVGGRCPTCSYFLSAQITRKNVEYYPGDTLAASRNVTAYLPYFPGRSN